MIPIHIIYPVAVMPLVLPMTGFLFHRFMFLLFFRGR